MLEVLNFEFWVLSFDRNEWLPNQACSCFCGSFETFHQKFGIRRRGTNQRPQKRGEEYFKKSVDRRRPARFPGIGDLKGKEHVLKKYSCGGGGGSCPKRGSFWTRSSYFLCVFNRKGSMMWYSEVPRPVVANSQRSIKKQWQSHFFHIKFKQEWIWKVIGMDQWRLP